MKRNTVSNVSTNTPKRQRRYDQGRNFDSDNVDDPTMMIVPEIANKDEKNNEAVVTTITTSAASTSLHGATKKRSYHNPIDHVRRALFPDPADQTQQQQLTNITIVPATPAKGTVVTTPAVVAASESKKGIITPSPTKRKLSFGRTVVQIEVKESVKQVYNIVQKLTGTIGGNCSFGPIYGELTMGSMQKVINVMKEYTQFDTSSTFIDVGSGIGKPNLHVMQDPGVSFSYGIEVEIDRWLLGMNCLRAVLNAVSEQQQPSHTKETTNKAIDVNQQLHYNCIFDHGDIMSAKSFDPFTHVYMFSIGFPPKLWTELSNMWNRSHDTSLYLICYHGPKQIIQKYKFHVVLLHQIPTQMHGSSEGHTCYIYQRSNQQQHHHQQQQQKNEPVLLRCDPYFQSSMEIVQGGFHSVHQYVNETVREQMGSNTRRTRSQQQQQHIR